MKNQELYGYDLYKSIIDQNEPNFKMIESIMSAFEAKYSNINDKNVAFELLHKAKKQQEYKKLSYNIITGLFASVMSVVLTNFLYENIVDIKRINLPKFLIIFVLAFVFLIAVIKICHKVVDKKFNNPYMMYILPYEIELLEKKLDELTKNKKTYKVQLSYGIFRKKRRRKVRRFR